MVWRAPCRVDGSGMWMPTYPFLSWRTPVAFEQYNCYSPIDASVAKLIRTYLALYRAACAACPPCLHLESQAIW